MRHRPFSRFLFTGILSSVLVIGLLYWVLLNYGSLIADSTADGFKKIPEGYQKDRVNLIKAIHPDKTYTYWAFCFLHVRKDSIIFTSGVKSPNLKLGTPKAMDFLFNDCLPGLCLKYITYIDHGEIGYVQTAAQLKQFLGTIDNLEEAILLAEVTEHISPDATDLKGGSYFIDANGYHLILMKYDLCPEKKKRYCCESKKTAE